jgi:hypothetical protein
MKYWELIAGGISKVRWGLGYVSAVDSDGERSGLLTHIATESGLLCIRKKS